jgi:PAS domain S-box-containing protein
VISYFVDTKLPCTKSLRIELVQEMTLLYALCCKPKPVKCRISSLTPIHLAYILAGFLKTIAILRQPMKDNDYKRLKQVRQFAGLDFASNGELQDIVKMAGAICNVPIVMITLMDEEIQLIKIVAGADVESNTRENSFCKYLMPSNEVMVVPDATKDERFVDNAIVTGDFHIRFYAGAPLVTQDGLHMGSLCVFDQQPQDFSESQKELLSILSKQVMNNLELKLAILKLEDQREQADLSERKLRSFFNSSAVCHLLIGRYLQVLDFNRASNGFVQQLQKKKIKLGCNIIDFISEAFQEQFLACFHKAMNGKSTTKEVSFKLANGQLTWWNVTFIPVKDEGNNITMVGFSATNITENKRYLDEITKQNSSLAEIAYIHSHEYRRPVASIIGLMELIGTDENEPKKEYLQMMELAVKELDDKIKSVVRHSWPLPEKSIQNLSN